jgi:hypothetical protein
MSTKGGERRKSEEQTQPSHNNSVNLGEVKYTLSFPTLSTLQANNCKYRFLNNTSAYHLCSLTHLRGITYRPGFPKVTFAHGTERMPEINYTQIAHVTLSRSRLCSVGIYLAVVLFSGQQVAAPSSLVGMFPRGPRFEPAKGKCSISLLSDPTDHAQSLTFRGRIATILPKVSTLLSPYLPLANRVCRLPIGRL